MRPCLSHATSTAPTWTKWPATKAVARWQSARVWRELARPFAGHSPAACPVRPTSMPEMHTMNNQMSEHDQPIDNEPIEDARFAELLAALDTDAVPVDHELLAQLRHRSVEVYASECKSSRSTP